MTEHAKTQHADQQREAKETSDENIRTTVWMDVGHIPPQPEGVLEAAAWQPNSANKILVYADSGEVVAPQPEYPTYEEPVNEYENPVLDNTLPPEGGAKKSGS